MIPLPAHFSSLTNQLLMFYQFKDTYTRLHPGSEQEFRASFRVLEGDKYSEDLNNPSSPEFKTRARYYKEGVNLIFRRSILKAAYLGTEILALDGDQDRNLIVHLTLRFDPRRRLVQSEEVSRLLAVRDTPYLPNKTLDPGSVSVRESSGLPNLSSLSSATSTEFSPASTAPPPRTCVPVQLPYCAGKTDYNFTSYPNIFGHKSLRDVENDVIAFRELVDGECFQRAFEFICQILQPACKKGHDDDEMVLPCQQFCRDFLAGCGGRLMPKFQQSLNCSRFPEFSPIGASCTSKPGCNVELESKGMRSRLCDGVLDCGDMTDETNCHYCPPGYIHCGHGKHCIPPTNRCNAILDCPNGSDEKACLTLAPDVAALGNLRSAQPALYHSEGYVIFNERGLMGKICTANLNATIPPQDVDSTLHTIAASLCHTLSYKKVADVQIKEDTSKNGNLGGRYVHMENPLAPEITFIPAPCPSKQVLYVSCDEMECGTQTARELNGVDGLGKMAAPGDWPWHAALFRENVHICDGTLVSPQWVLTTVSCFQGQSKAEWIARLGSVRLQSTSPWQQERHVIGMVKSPVEGSTVVMIKLNKPVIFSDFIRPICLPPRSLAPQELIHCHTLGWAKNREFLERIEVSVIQMDLCANISITSVNGVCTESVYQQNDCNEEELAGSPMICMRPEGKSWVLAGISNWRIACSQPGMQRPRLYDKISSNIDWIDNTIKQI
nr:PREDICTED: atrial natriuretic peptide-converting enzyme-like isoform X2 [Bemisia tabaci]